MTVDMAKERIRYAYDRGERRIVVTPDVFYAYGDYLVANVRYSQPEHGMFQKPQWLAFKDAQVILDTGTICLDKLRSHVRDLLELEDERCRLLGNKRIVNIEPPSGYR